MKIKNYLVLIYLPLLALLLASCQTLKPNRKPQTAGFRGYCPTCLVKNIDEELGNLQNIMEASHKRLVTHKKKSLSAYSINIAGECAEGYMEGTWGKNKSIEKKYHSKLCFIDKNRALYTVYANKKCKEGYIEGRRYKNDDDYDSKKCLLKNKLSNRHTINIAGECEEGYMEGTWRKNKSIEKKYHSKLCFINQNRALYTVYANKKCKEGYIEGRRYKNDDDYDSKKCLLKNKLSNRYTMNIAGECEEGYIEGVLYKNDDDYDSKKCLLKNELHYQYMIYVDGKCEEGYIEGVLYKNDDDYDSKECVFILKKQPEI